MERDATSVASSPRRPTSPPASSRWCRPPTTSSVRSSRISPLVDLISFTGSTVTGKRIFEKGSATMKRLFLELGGKSADIVLDDADLESKMAMASMVCVHGGQGCVMPTRMLVQRSIYDKAIEIATPGFENFPYGDPTDAGNLMGPQISAKQARPRPRLHREGQGGRRPGGRRRWTRRAVRQGLVRAAHALRRRRQLDDHRPGGDLRARAHRDPVRHRRRRGAHRQRQPVRTRRVRHVGFGGTGDRDRPSPAGRHRRRERRRLLRRRRSVRRIQGEWCGSPGRHRGPPAVHRGQDHRHRPSPE